MARPDLVQSESFGSLVRGILADLRLLIRKEMALAGVELREQASRAKAAAISLFVAFGALAIGFVFLLVALATAIADALSWPVWAGFLTLAVVLCVAGLAAMLVGRQRDGVAGAPAESPRVTPYGPRVYYRLPWASASPCRC